MKSPMSTRSDLDPFSTEKGSTLDAHLAEHPKSLWPYAIRGEGMEHLWSPAGATGGNRWQMGRAQKPLK